MKKLYALMIVGLVGCAHMTPTTKTYPINKTTAVARCKGERCSQDYNRKEMMLQCKTPVEIDSGYSENAGYWLLYSCYTCVIPVRDKRND